MMQGTLFSLNPYLDVIYRHRKVALCSAIVGLTLTCFAAVLLPRTYESLVVIAVRPSQLPSQIVSGPSAGIDFKSRALRLQQEVLNTTSLASVIEHYRLYPWRRVRGQGLRQTAAEMRTQVDVNLAAEDEWNRARWGSLRISFAYPNPVVAQQVTAALAQLFIERDLNEQKEQARAATAFLDDQLVKSQAKLDAKTREIKAFKDQFQGSLPEDLDVNLKTLATLQGDLAQATASQSSLEERQMDLDRSLAGAQQRSVTIPSATGQATWPNPQAALAALETQLTVLKAQYSDQYPDVVQLRAEIAALKKTFGETSAQRGGQSGSPSALDQELRRQRDVMAGEDGRLRAQIGELRHKISDYEERIRLIPVHEQQLSNLSRDYTVLTSNYQDLLQKKLGARMYQSLVESGEAGDSLQVTEAASFSGRPSFPRTSTVLLAGGFLSVLVALGLPFVLFLTDSSLKDLEDFEQYGIPIVATIPSIDVPDTGREHAPDEWSLGQAVAICSICIILGTGALWVYSSRFF
jgi:protein tyrosine kinase modulator